MGGDCYAAELEGRYGTGGAESRTTKQYVVCCLLSCCLLADHSQGLVIRVLHRLRSLSEQAPFDSATFSYAFPLLAQVLTLGGISPEDEDEALEQVALALDIIKFHCSECLYCFLVYPSALTMYSVSDTTFPRKQTMEILLHIIRQQPKLSKEGSSALVDLGEVSYPSASREELDVLLNGTLMQEVYVRNSCLQALQVNLISSVGFEDMLIPATSLLISQISTGARSYGLRATTTMNRTVG